MISSSFSSSKKRLFCKCCSLLLQTSSIFRPSWLAWKRFFSWRFFPLGSARLYRLNLFNFYFFFWHGLVLNIIFSELSISNWSTTSEATTMISSFSRCSYSSSLMVPSLRFFSLISKISSSCFSTVFSTQR